MIELFQKIPGNFHSKVDVASIYFTVGQETLFLQRAGSERGSWGVPAGKLELGESLEMGAQRELFEETGISCDHLVSLTALYMRKPNIDYTYHIFTASFEAKPDIIISDEHLAYGWFTLDQVRNLPLMEGAIEAFEYFLSLIKL